MKDEIEFLFIGWCCELKGVAKHDKVWTAFKAGQAYYAGWGARGKAIRFKKHDGLFELKTVMRKKQKTYEEVDKFLLFSMLPNFEEEVSQKLMMSILTDKVM